MQIQKQSSVFPNGNTGADAPDAAPRWNAEAASVLRKVCRLSGDALARNLAWWKRVRDKGERVNVRDRDIVAAIRGASSVMRLDPPWWPCRVFCRRNAALWQEAMSAGHRLADREAKQVGQTPLIATLERLAREAR